MGLLFLTWWLHQAGPELWNHWHRVGLGAAQLVQVNTWRCAHVTVVAHEKVKVLTGETETAQRQRLQ